MQHARDAKKYLKRVKCPEELKEKRSWQIFKIQSDNMLSRDS